MFYNMCASAWKVESQTIKSSLSQESKPSVKAIFLKILGFKWNTILCKL